MGTWVLYKTKCSDLPLTPGYPHVGSHLEAWVNVDDCAPHNVTGKMSRDELHGGCQVVSGLVTLLWVVICVVRVKNDKGEGTSVNIYRQNCKELTFKRAINYFVLGCTQKSQNLNKLKAKLSTSIFSWLTIRGVEPLPVERLVLPDVFFTLGHQQRVTHMAVV